MLFFLHTRCSVEFYFVMIRALMSLCGLVKLPREKETEIIIIKKGKTDGKKYRKRVVLRTLQAGERGV